MEHKELQAELVEQVLKVLLEQMVEQEHKVLLELPVEPEHKVLQAQVQQSTLPQSQPAHSIRCLLPQVDQIKHQA